jgi:hypothetical protein
MAVNGNIREIDTRQNHGTVVTLLAQFGVTGTAEFAIVTVESPSENFSISEIPLSKALDVYHHPFFYANQVLTSGRIAA